MLQGNQLAALTQAKNAQGQPAKVVTIQLQVQQPQQKIQIVPQPPSSQPQPQPPPPPSTQPVTLSSVQQAQIMGPGQSPGQRLSVPLKVVLQPQVSLPQGAGRTDLLAPCCHPPQPLTVQRGVTLESRLRTEMQSFIPFTSGNFVLMIS